ncbi:MAG TPA: AsmA-like C-terminal region-containing protein [Cytophagales bacterium]|nr:AsmA-like C-terminal region-containing protein [Cytophagales bacterium]
MFGFRKLRKVLVITAITIGALLITAGILSYVYQDKIISLVVAELNKKLSTPVSVEKISFSFWSKFPDVALRFQNIEVQESIIPAEKPLLKAKDVYLTFNLFSFFGGNYNVNDLYIEEGTAFIRLNKKGEKNYEIIKKSEGASPTEVKFELENIIIKSVDIVYADEFRDQEYKGKAKNIKAKLSVKGPDIGIFLDGGLYVSGIRIEDDVYFAKKDLSIKGDLNYNQSTDKLLIAPSSLLVNNSKFKVEGFYFNNSSSLIDLKINGEDTNIQTILSLLPSDISGKFTEYKSEGAVYFNAVVTGAVKKTTNPGFSVDFGCSNTSFYHPDLKQRVEKASFSGSFNNGRLRNFTTSVLRLSKVSGMFDGRSFKGNLILEDFNSPYLEFDLDANIDIHSLLQFYPMSNVKSAQGLLDVSLNFKGQVNSLKKYSASREINASGEVTLQDLKFKLDQRNIDFNSFNGNFIFSKNDLAINDFSGKVGKSDFLLNGLFRNVISYLLIPGQPLGIDARLKADYLDFDELLLDDKAGSTEGGYHFQVSPDLVLKLDCDVKQARFRRFNGKNIIGKLDLKGQQAVFNDISLNVAGGTAKFDGTLDARKADFLQLETTSNYQNIHIDSIFYVFEDFGQNFISYKNLKGQAFADIKSYVVLNSKLEPDYNKLTAYMSGRIRNGELVNFEPMQKLSRFVDEEALANLKFSELKNEIQIYNRTVFIPEMDIGSNVSNISLHGTHTFDQLIDYRLRVPLRNFRKRDSDESFGAIEEDNTGKTTLHLIIKGTADNYRITYDRESVKQKIKKDMQKEKQEFLNIFKKEDSVNEPEKEKRLNEEEYFDF